jgi:DNA polymerase-1
MHQECILCKLHRSSAQPVKYRGNLESPVVLVGEAPGRDEDESGEPFVGRAGQVLEEALQAVQFPVEPLVTNAVRCRPPGNAKPTKGEIVTCATNYMFPLIQAHPRKVVVAMGRTAWAALNPIPQRSGMSTKSIRQINGTILWQPDVSAWLVPTYHPAAGFYNPAAHTPMVEALRLTGEVYQHGVNELDIQYVSIDQKETAIAAIDSIPDGSLVTFDIETMGLNPLKHGITMMAFYYSHDEPAIVIDNFPEIESPEFWDALERLFLRCKVVGHNIKFDGEFIYVKSGKRKVFLYGWAGCTMIEHYLTDENMPHGLKALSSLMLRIASYEEDMLKQAADKPNLEFNQEWMQFPVQRTILYIPKAAVRRYNAADVFCTFEVKHRNDKALKEQNLGYVYESISLPLVPILAKAELRGTLFDVEWGRAYNSYLKSKEDALGKLFRDIDVNPLSHHQVYKLLFTNWNLPTDGLERAKKTRKVSVGESNLRICASRVKDEEQKLWFRRILLARGINKTRSTYLGQIFGSLDENNAIHTHYLVAPAPEEFEDTVDAGGTVSGRLSSVNPNLQNIPPIIKPLFLARPGFVIVDVDYKQTEMKGLALYSDDSALLEAVHSVDPHNAMVRNVWPDKYGHLTDEQIKAELEDVRTEAKTGVYRTMYGGGPVGMARQLGITVEEAQEIQRQLFAAMPEAVRWIDNTKRFVEEHGYVFGYHGRRRRLPTIWSDDDYVRETSFKQAVNSPIQGLGAEITYLGMIQVDNWLIQEKLDDMIFLLLTTHDSATYEVHESVLEKFLANLDELMTITLKTVSGRDVRFNIDYHVGNRWKGEPSLADLSDYLEKESLIQ